MHAKRYIICCFIVAAIVGFVLMLLPESQSVMRVERLTVVIDAGHGGLDGGAVGRQTGVREDGLNLIVAKKLQSLFEKNGFKVVMTRQDEKWLGTSKQADMAKRREIIQNADADVVISIHMNKFQDSRVSGPMVFYHEDSEEGKILAELIQTELNTRLEPPKPRTFKPETYFILRAGECPCVLVECGFLSNEREERLLQTDEYQEQCAKAIYAGVRAYFDQLAEAGPTPEPQLQPHDF
jgi:N-acetylmuramoyl-L-alanine amidase